MPIRPEEKARYPKDWPQISQRVRLEAGNKCEWCGVPNGELGGRLESGKWCKAAGYDHPGDRPIEGQIGTCWVPATKFWPAHAEGLRIVRIVLTVAHLDHVPEHCERENLKALCQRCHLRYDAKHHRTGILERARQALGIDDLFESFK